MRPLTDLLTNAPTDQFADSPTTLKVCCAAVYESDWTRLLLGESLHPGGLVLTERLDTMLDLGPEHHVLDVAAGRGASALHLAQTFGCRVTGVDYGAGVVDAANEAAATAGLAKRVHFRQGDAEQLPFPAAHFDAVICECAFCTFPDKETAAAEMARVLRPNGRLGLSDLTRNGPLPPELDTLLGWVACIADAQPLAEYAHILETAALPVDATEIHDHDLAEMIREIRARLLGAELLLKLHKIQPPDIDINLDQARSLARIAAETVRGGKLGYALLTATRAA